MEPKKIPLPCRRCMCLWNNGDGTKCDVELATKMAERQGLFPVIPENCPEGWPPTEPKGSKGLDKYTHEILKFVVSRGSVSINSIIEAFGISRNAAHERVGKLIQDGMVHVRYEGIDNMIVEVA